MPRCGALPLAAGLMLAADTATTVLVAVSAAPAPTKTPSVDEVSAYAEREPQCPVAAAALEWSIGLSLGIALCSLLPSVTWAAPSSSTAVDVEKTCVSPLRTSKSAVTAARQSKQWGVSKRPGDNPLLCIVLGGVAGNGAVLCFRDLIGRNGRDLDVSVVSSILQFNVFFPVVVGLVTGTPAAARLTAPLAAAIVLSFLSAVLLLFDAETGVGGGLTLPDYAVLLGTGVLLGCEDALLTPAVAQAVSSRQLVSAHFVGAWLVTLLCIGTCPTVAFDVSARSDSALMAAAALVVLRLTAMAFLLRHTEDHWNMSVVNLFLSAGMAVSGLYGVAVLGEECDAVKAAGMLGSLLAVALCWRGQGGTSTRHELQPL